MNQKEMKKKINYILFIFLLFNSYVKCVTYYKNDGAGNLVKVAFCPSYMTPINGDNNKLECIDSLDDCKIRGLYYYNREDLKCFISLPSAYYENEIDTTTGLPKEDEGKNTITLKSKVCKSSYFPKLANSPKRCQRECNSGEYFKSNEPNKCLSTCFSTANDYNIYYIGSNNECVKECPYFYIEETVGTKIIKKCVVDCKDDNKFFFKNEKKCYDNCLEGGHKFFILETNKKECLDTCQNNALKKYVKNGGSPRECLALSSNDYFDEDYNILNGNSCGSLYESLTNDHKCVSNCINSNYTNNNVKECISCANNYKYFSTDVKDVQCFDSCDYILDFRINYDKECLANCPQNYLEKTIDSKKHCNTIQCPDGKLRQVDNCDECRNYYIIDGQGINVCQNSCSSPNFIKDEEDKECVSICPEYNNVISSPNKCGKFCNTNEKLDKVSTQTINGKSYTIYECKTDCPFFVKEIVEGRKEYCFNECPDRFQFKLNDASNKECIQECPENNFYDINVKDSNNYYTCKDQNPCTNDNDVYCEGKCINKNSCLNEKIYFINNKICTDKCLNKYRKLTVTGGFISDCINTCESTDYIIGSECLERCPKELNYIGNGNKCKNGCNSETGGLTYYKFKENYADYTIYNCVAATDCSFTRAHHNFCYDSCPKETYQLDNKCYENCFLSDKHFSLKLNENQPGECLDSSCKDGYKYYYETDQVCLDKCKNDDYADEDTNKCVTDCKLLGDNYYSFENTNAASGVQKKFCVRSCRNPQPYLYGKTCVESCGFPESEKRYIVKGGSSANKCLTDCISPYKYYKIKGDIQNNKHYYECSSTLKEEGYNFYVPNSNQVGQKSLTECNYNSETYKYKIGDKCYEHCPSEKPYYLLNNADNQCYVKCPNSAPFHEIDQSDLNSFICKTLAQCNNEYADINVVGGAEVKECLRNDEKCEDSKKVGISDGKFVCLNQCGSTTYGQFLTEYDTCTNNCDGYTLESNLLNYKQEGENCICTNLFYRAENEKTCFPNSINSCKNSNTIYKISFGEKECITVCDNNRILSLDEATCYQNSNSFECSSHDPNTDLLVRTDGIKKCDCQNKFYLNTDTNLKTCFDGQCDVGFNQKYVPEIKRCMKNGESCPTDFNHIFLDKFCLRQCPSGSILTNSGSEVKCECKNDKKFWREITENSYECLIKCFDIHPVYIAETFQCVEKCPNDYDIFYEFKCFASCDSTRENDLKIKNGIQIVNEQNHFATYTCDCAKKIVLIVALKEALLLNMR